MSLRKKVISGSLTVLVVTAFGVLFWFWYRDQKNFPTLQGASQTPSISLLAVVDSGDGQKFTNVDPMLSKPTDNSVNHPALILMVGDDEPGIVDNIAVVVSYPSTVHIDAPVPKGVTAAHFSRRLVWKVPSMQNQTPQYLMLPFTTEGSPVAQSFTLQYAQQTSKLGSISLGSTSTYTVNGFSFSFPSSLQLHSVGSSEGNAANYTLTSSNGAASWISVSLPLKESSLMQTFLDRLHGQTTSTDVTQVMLNGHEGQSMTYRQDTAYPGDIPVHAQITYEEYSTRYSKTPLILEYFQNDHDASLDTAWSAVRSSIQYSK